MKPPYFQLLEFKPLTGAVLNGVDLDGTRGFRHPQFYLQRALSGRAALPDARELAAGV